MRSLAVLMFALVALSDSAAGAAPGPVAESVYRLEATLQDQTGRTLDWRTNRGEIRIATMFYASCPHTCPVIVETLKAVEAAVPADMRGRLRIDMISFDPERDTPQRLQALAVQRGIDDPRWRLYRASDADALRLAALLGIRYRKLPDGEFNHASVMILLDAEGRMLARSTRLGSPEPQFVGAVKKALEASH